MKCRQDSDVLTEITLISTMDELDARKGRIKTEEIRQVTVPAFAGEGRWTLVINEEIRQKLGLRITSYEDCTEMDGTKDLYKMAGPIDIWWKNRSFCCCAIVVPDAPDILLGRILLFALDLMTTPQGGLVGVHGDIVMHRV